MAVLNYVLVLYNLVTLNDCPIIFWFHAFFDVYFYMKTYFTMHEVRKQDYFCLCSRYLCNNSYQEITISFVFSHYFFQFLIYSYSFQKNDLFSRKLVL